jgi:hypothetical protein
MARESHVAAGSVTVLDLSQNNLRAAWTIQSSSTRLSSPTLEQLWLKREYTVLQIFLLYSRILLFSHNWTLWMDE